MKTEYQKCMDGDLHRRPGNVTDNVSLQATSPKS